MINQQKKRAKVRVCRSLTKILRLRCSYCRKLCMLQNEASRIGGEFSGDTRGGGLWRWKNGQNKIKVTGKDERSTPLETATSGQHAELRVHTILRRSKTDMAPHTQSPPPGQKLVNELLASAIHFSLCFSIFFFVFSFLSPLPLRSFLWVFVIFFGCHRTWIDASPFFTCFVSVSPLRGANNSAPERKNERTKGK